MIFLKKIFSKKISIKDKNFVLLEKKINYKFKNVSYLKNALTHKSKKSNPKENYERLEFLGDAILDYVVSNWIYKNYKNKNEGELTTIRSSLVNRDFLAYVGLKLELLNFLKSDSSVDLYNEKVSKNIAADIYESIIGAISLDGGLEYAEKFIYQTLIINMHKAKSNINYKGELIEICHKLNLQPPQFKLVNSEGPEHNKIFDLTVILSDGQEFHGKCSNIKSAEQKAAKIAIKSLKKNIKSKNSF